MAPNPFSRADEPLRIDAVGFVRAALGRDSGRWRAHHRLVVALAAASAAIASVTLYNGNGDTVAANPLGAVVNGVAAAGLLAVAGRVRARGVATAAAVVALCLSNFAFNVVGGGPAGAAGGHLAVTFVILALYPAPGPVLAAGPAVLLAPGAAHLTGQALVGDDWSWFAALGGVWAAVAIGSLTQTLAAQRAEELAEEQRRILDRLGDCILRVAGDGTVTYENPASRDVLGPLVGSALPGELAEVCAAAVRDVHQARVDVPGRDGDPVPVTVATHPVDGADGAFDGWIVVVTDLRDRLRAEGERVERERIAAVAAAQAQTLTHLHTAIAPHLDVDGVDVGVAYVPAGGVPIGGDLYDCVRLPDGTVHITVVDVAGHGIEATAAAVDATHALRTLAAAGTPLEGLVADAAAIYAQTRKAKASVAVVHYDPVTGRLRVAGGGHPPVLVCGPDGTVTELAVRGLGFGMPRPGTLSVSEATVPDGGLVVVYTDGLIEADRNPLEGLEQLAKVVAATAQRCPVAQSCAERIVTDLVGTAGGPDDSLAFTLRRSTH